MPACRNVLAAGSRPRPTVHPKTGCRPAKLRCRQERLPGGIHAAPTSGRKREFPDMLYLPGGAGPLRLLRRHLPYKGRLYSTARQRLLFSTALGCYPLKKAPLPGELAAQRPEGSYYSAAPHFPGHSNVFFIIPVSFFSYKKRTKRISTKKGMGVPPCLFYWNFFGPFFVKKGHSPKLTP